MAAPERPSMPLGAVLVVGVLALLGAVFLVRLVIGWLVQLAVILALVALVVVLVRRFSR